MTEQATAPDPLSVLDDYDFDLPEANIAQSPTPEREAARLLVLDRTSGERAPASGRQHVSDLPAWLRPGDLVVVNATRVVPARLVGRKRSGGSAEALLLGPDVASEAPGGNDFRALVKCTGRVRTGLELDWGDGETLKSEITALHSRGEVTLRFEPGTDPYSVGEAPLPPYIRRGRDTTDGGEGEASGASLRAEDLDRYQTVFAREPGAIAAPTAGLHLTESLFNRLEARGVERAEVVLHVGAGTFRPLDAEALESGRLHEETFALPQATVDAIERTRARKGRVVAVGTTTTRVLESRADANGKLVAGRGTTNLFIRPEHGTQPFKVVDALLTNFHLPRSSLLMLVAAFTGREPLLAAYREAIRDGFRFYSYGDAMLIAPRAERSDDA